MDLISKSVIQSQKLAHAIEDGNLELCRKLLDSHFSPSMLNLFNCYHVSGLIRQMIQLGIDGESKNFKQAVQYCQDQIHGSVLEHAIKHHRPKCVQLLIDKKVDLMLDEPSRSAYALTTNYMAFDCLHVIMDNTPHIRDFTLKRQLIEYGRRNELFGMRKLIEMKVDIHGDRLGRFVGYAPLIRILPKKTNIDCVEYLIRQKANINARLRSGRTALQNAIEGFPQRSSIPIVQTILEAKAIIGQIQEQSMLEYCAKNNKKELIPLLQEYS